MNHRTMVNWLFYNIIIIHLTLMVQSKMGLEQLFCVVSRILLSIRF